MSPLAHYTSDVNTRENVNSCGQLTMRLSDARLRRRPTKLIYPDHRPTPWFTEDAAPRSLGPIVRSEFGTAIKCIYNKYGMTYDPAKRRSNKRKHKIDLADCEAAFDAPMLTREDASQDYGEQRLTSLGWLQGRVVVLVWTDRADGPRLISCRGKPT
jgi:uncharacterized DUF497 family protein